MNNYASKLPGFTAEASLYTRGGHHYLSEGSVPTAELGLQAVFPSQAAGGRIGGQVGSWWQCWYLGSCIICCSPWWCWWACYGRASQASAG
jgi:hypothetical protein